MAAESAESNRISALAKAESEKKAAVLNEQKRIDKEKETARLETERRASDRVHVSSIRSDVKTDLMLLSGIDEILARQVVIAISQGRIKHTKITY